MATQRKYPDESYYHLLGVAPTAGRGEIRQAYLRLIAAARSGGFESSDRSAVLSEAYEVLLDPVQRTAYDNYLTWRQSPRQPKTTWTETPKQYHEASPRPLAVYSASGEAVQILYAIGFELGGVVGFRSVTILSAGKLQELCWELRAILRIQQFPSLTFRRLADKKYRPSAMVGGPMGWITARFLPLRFLDGTRYEEFTFASEADNRILLVERRYPAKQGQSGRLIRAFVLVSSESGGALRGGSPSPSVRAWFNGPEMVM